MTQYLISFGAHAMDHVPDEDAPAVARAARAAVQEAINAGVYVSAGGLKTSRRASWPPAGRSPKARTRRPSAGSRSSTCPHARRRCGGLPRSPSPAAARKRSGRSGPTPNSTRCSARLIAGGDVPAAPGRTRPAALEQDLPWRRPDNAGLSRGRGASASWTGCEARSSRLTGPPQPLTARWSDSQARRGEWARSPADPKRWQAVGYGSDRTQNIQFGAPRASRLGDQVAAPNGGYIRASTMDRCHAE